jgi:cytochrome c peroxidase
MRLINNNFVSISIVGISAFLLISGTIDLDNLLNYANQTRPNYIVKDNTPINNPITDAGATLGRVLFYDKQMSLNGNIACASCHKQSHAFGDDAVLSIGFEGGQTGRHSMRLINARFETETRFFWDERANTLEAQTSMPIQDHVEMGFSGTNGQPSIDSLITRLMSLPYYAPLFQKAYGSIQITEDKIQRALGQFIRSIQSCDSKYDIGRAQTGNDQQPFANFTQQENQGKQLFLAPPPQGGAGCAGCHRPPEFDIDPASRNNGVIGVAGSPGTLDLNNTRAPSLRDLFNSNGELNGPLMHNGVFTTIEQALNHYNLVPQNPNNTNLDPRLQGPGGNLGLTIGEREAIAAFLKTLTGSDVYTNEKWSNPFDASGNITILPLPSAQLVPVSASWVNISPNPTTDFLIVQNESISNNGSMAIQIFSATGQLIHQISPASNHEKIDVSNWKKGIYFIEISASGKKMRKKFLKN